MSDTTDIKSITRDLAAPFDPSEVRFKPQMVKGNKALALAYVDARCVQDRLDDVLGVEGWTEEYQLLPDGSVTCRLSCKIGEDWITKQDVGSPSEQPDGGDRLKAAYSDALKRTAVKFGIGRYLYRLPAQWLDYDPQKRQFVRPPQVPTPRPTPRAEAKPTPSEPAKSRSGLPSDGRELQRRLQEYDAKLAARGLCPVGALVQHVTQAGVKQGYGADLTSWSGPAIALAVAETRAFETKHEAPAREPKAVA